jgi:hypothetical protein
MTRPAILNINTSIVAHGDPTLTNNPRLKFFDWTRNLNGVEVFSPKAEQYVVAAGTNITAFDGTVALGSQADTELSIRFLEGSTYRIQHTAGTDPQFAYDNAVSFAGIALSAVVNANQTLTLTDTTAGASLAACAEGSIVYIYSALDDIDAAFSAANAGRWTVLSNSTGNVIILARPDGESFQGLTENVTCSSAGNLISYTENLHLGSKVWLGAPFSNAAKGVHEVSAFTSKWIDIISTVPLPDQASFLVDITAGSETILAFNICKRFLRVEVDQLARVRINGEIVRRNVAPWSPADPDRMGWLEQTGYVWKLQVENETQYDMSLNIFSAE